MCVAKKPNPIRTLNLMLSHSCHKTKTKTKKKREEEEEEEGRLQGLLLQLRRDETGPGVHRSLQGANTGRHPKEYAPNKKAR